MGADVVAETEGVLAGLAGASALPRPAALAPAGLLTTE